MRPTSSLSPLQIVDDLRFANMAEALEKNISRLKVAGAAAETLRFGPKKIATSKYIDSLQVLLDSLKRDPSGQEYLKIIDEKFEFLEVYGDREWGDVFITSYYEPTLQGSVKRTDEFSEALYETPKDLLTIRLGDFEHAYAAFRNPAVEFKPLEGVLRARLVSAEPPQASAIAPYLTREQIERDSLNKTAKVLAWVDPIDAFFLHTQGSGRVVLTNGPKPGREIRVGYADQNGYPYVSIGKNLFDKIPKDKMSRQKIEAYLRSLPKDRARALMDENPSFIFFQSLKGGALSSFGAEVTAGRTIATDGKFFPKGALAFLQFQMPEFAPAASGALQAVEPVGYKTVTRFVVDQDSGGAIRGPARVDLFAGSGPEADRMSGVMRHRGRLYYLVPRQ